MSSPNNTQSPRGQRWWEHLGRLADVLQVLGWVGIPSAAVIFGVLWATGGGDAASEEAAPAPDVTASPTVGVPGWEPDHGENNTSPSPSPQEPQDLLFNFFVDTTYARGKDKAFACPDGDGVHCLAIENTVSGREGQLSEGCYLHWELYRKGGGKPVERESVGNCGDTIYVGEDIPLEAGWWRLKAYVELHDGTTGTGTYDFQLINR